MVFLKKTDFLEMENTIKGKLEQVFKNENLTYRTITSRSELRKMLLKLDQQYRDVLKNELGGTPLFSYRLLEERNDNSLRVTVQRESFLEVKFYKEFKFNEHLPSFEITETARLFEKQKELYGLLTREGLMLKNLLYLNNYIAINLKEVHSPFEVVFTPDVFPSKPLEFISDEKLVLTANFESTFDVLSHLYSLDELSFDKYNKQEEDCFSLYQSTVEILARRTPMLDSLLGEMKLNLKKTLRSPFVRTFQQLQIYPKAKGTGYYLEQDVFAVVKRTDYGNIAPLSPINVKTFVKEDVDLLEFID